MTELRIEKLGAKGDGIGLLDGAEVFAPYTVPGELVEGEIVDDRMPKPRILEPVPLRVKAPCSHFKTCGGCLTQHIDGAFLADWKRDLDGTRRLPPHRARHVEAPLQAVAWLVRCQQPAAARASLLGRDLALHQSDHLCAHSHLRVLVS